MAKKHRKASTHAGAAASKRRRCTCGAQGPSRAELERKSKGLARLLDQWDREDPATPEERAAAERLVEQLFGPSQGRPSGSFSTPAHYPRRRITIVTFGSSSEPLRIVE